LSMVLLPSQFPGSILLRQHDPCEPFSGSSTRKIAGTSDSKYPNELIPASKSAGQCSANAWCPAGVLIGEGVRSATKFVLDHRRPTGNGQNNGHVHATPLHCLDQRTQAPASVVDFTDSNRGDDCWIGARLCERPRRSAITQVQQPGRGSWKSPFRRSIALYCPLRLPLLSPQSSLARWVAAFS
jgi:hypothetical protein